MSEQGNAATGCVIKTADLFNFINERRQSDGKQPIEHSSIATRCTLRFNVDKQRGADFSQAQVTLDRSDIPVLEQLVNAQFELYLSGELARLCQGSAPAAAKTRRAAPPPPTAAAEPEDKKGLMSRLKGMFGND
jgi:hypothetical protein